MEKQNITLEELLKINNITSTNVEIDEVFKEITRLLNNNEVEIDVFHNIPVIKIKFFYKLKIPSIPPEVFKEYIKKTHAKDSYIHVHSSVTPMVANNDVKCKIKIHIFFF